MINAQNLSKVYRIGDIEVQALKSVDFNIEPSSFIAFIGPSGSGKTTLLNLLGGLDVPTSGTVTVDGDEITHMSGPKLARWRARHVGFIFQMYNLIPVLTAFQNVELPLLLTKLSKSQRRRHVETALTLVGLGDRMKHFPRQLSGGQEQRVAIACGPGGIDSQAHVGACRLVVLPAESQSLGARLCRTGHSAHAGSVAATEQQ